MRKKIVALAALTLGVPESDIDLEDGEAIARGGNRPRLSLGELARLAQGMPGVSFAAGQTPGLEHTAYFTRAAGLLLQRHARGRGRGRHDDRRRARSSTTRSRTTAASIINPLIVDGQVQGGVAHGIGNALFEQMIYDENAQPLTTTFADYLLPTATDVPTCRHRAHRDAEPAQSARRQGRGRGRHDSGACRHRQRRSRTRCPPFGVRFAEAPLTPDRIVAALRAAGAYESLIDHGRSGHHAGLAVLAVLARASIGEPGVAAACIDLQDQAGVDVNMLLFLLWNATLKRTLPADAVDDLERRIGAWRDATVIPLRALRRALKISAAGGRAGRRRSVPHAHQGRGARSRAAAAADHVRARADPARSQPPLRRCEAARTNVAAYQAICPRSPFRPRRSTRSSRPCEATRRA